MRLGFVGAALFCAALSGCGTSAPTTTATPAAAGAMQLTPVSFDQLPGWGSDDLAAALVAFRAGCPHASDLWQRACAAVSTVPAGDRAARDFFERNFQAFAITGDGSADGLFTGYYEPEIRGSLTRTTTFATPLLGRPTDLVDVDLGNFDPELAGRTLRGRVQAGRLVPYDDRARIEAGDPAAAPLLYVADPVDAFFLEIQGSGRVRLPDGSVVRVSYADENGRPYVAVGKVLIDRGDIPRAQVSLQSIRAWLTAHPDQAKNVMDQDPSYVFFRQLPNVPPDRGPPGSQGIALTPGRSMAVDTRYIPLGSPVWVDTADPTDGSPLQRLMIAQDTGGAIKGPVRGDFFWGWGKDAETRAGLMKSPGRAFLLRPR